MSTLAYSPDQRPGYHYRGAGGRLGRQAYKNRQRGTHSQSQSVRHVETENMLLGENWSIKEDGYHVGKTDERPGTAV